MDSGGVSPLRSSLAAAICLSVSGFMFLCRLLAKLLGGLFIQAFLGHEDASGRRIDANGATRAKRGGPRGQVQGPRGPTYLCPRGPVCIDPSPRSILVT